MYPKGRWWDNEARSPSAGYEGFELHVGLGGGEYGWYFGREAAGGSSTMLPSSSTLHAGPSIPHRNGAGSHRASEGGCGGAAGSLRKSGVGGWGGVQRRQGPGA